MGPKRQGTAPRKQRADPISRSPKSTTKESSDSQGSAPLSDPYTATHVLKGDQNVVVAPMGASRLSVQRRSNRLAAASATPSQISTPQVIFSKTAPDGKKSIGWRYKVVEGDGESSTPVTSDTPDNLHGNINGPWNVDATPAGSKDRSVAPGVGRKRTATSEAPGSESRAKGPASAVDFPRDHWDEEMSDREAALLLKSPPVIHGAERDGPRSPHRQTATTSKDLRGSPKHVTSSPMKVDEHSAKGKLRAILSPSSSPISQNPLLAKKVAPIPLRPQIPNVQTTNAHWLNSHGLIPVGDNINAPGYVSGGKGIQHTYCMHYRPRLRTQLIAPVIVHIDARLTDGHPHAHAPHIPASPALHAPHMTSQTPAPHAPQSPAHHSALYNLDFPAPSPHAHHSVARTNAYDPRTFAHLRFSKHSEYLIPCVCVI
jgi:hypothetical protein